MDLIPRGEKITVLDIGVGANCIYSLLGSREYGWSFVGTEIIPKAISIVKNLIKQYELTNSIEILYQKSSTYLKLDGKKLLVTLREPFLTLCTKSHQPAKLRM